MTLDQKLSIIYLILGSVLAGIVYFMQNHREKKAKKAAKEALYDSIDEYAKVYYEGWRNHFEDNSYPWTDNLKKVAEAWYQVLKKTTVLKNL